MLRFRQLRYQFCTSNLFEAYLAEKETTITLTKRLRGQNAHAIVPNSLVSREKVREFFQKSRLEDRGLIVSADPSHCMGLHRLLRVQHLRKNVYKGLAQPMDSYAKENPTDSETIQGIQLDSNIFFLTDGRFKQLLEIEGRQACEERIADFYHSNPSQIIRRLKKEYNVAPQFLYIVEAAIMSDTPVYFGGLNQYDLRKILSRYYSLQKLKNVFMRALKYSRSKNKSLDYSYVYSREYIWKENFQMLHPFAYQHAKRVMKLLPNSMMFAPSFQYMKPSFRKEIQISKVMETETDSLRIEKNAILQVLLGPLWDRPYTNNPFPYLSEPYYNLSQEDRELVMETYNRHFSLYKQVMGVIYSN